MWITFSYNSSVNSDDFGSHCRIFCDGSKLKPMIEFANEKINDHFYEIARNKKRNGEKREAGGSVKLLVNGDYLDRTKLKNSTSYWFKHFSGKTFELCEMGSLCLVLPGQEARVTISVNGNKKAQKGLANIEDFSKTEHYVRNDKEKYIKNVRKLTEQTYKQYRDIIDPERLRGADWHLGHKFSAEDGYYYNVPESIVADVENLEMQPGPENVSQGSKSSITLSELHELTGNNKVAINE